MTTARRLLAILVVALLSAAACGSGDAPTVAEPATDGGQIRPGSVASSPTSAVPTTTSSSTSTTLAPVPAAEPGEPLVVATAGNSVLFDAEPALAAALDQPAYRFAPHTLGAFGLSVLPEVWQGVFGNDIATSDAADVVVVMLGNRDLPAVLVDPAGYARTLDDAVELLTQRGALVLWLGLPPLPPDPVNDRARPVLNGLLAELPAKHPGSVRYLDTDALLDAADGRWVRNAEPGVPLRKRRPDGSPDAHLCPEAARRITALVLDQIGAAGAGGWDADGARWRLDPRYDDPPGGCQP